MKEAEYVSPRLAYASVILLTLVYLLGFLDRIVLSLLVEPVKEDLGLTDTQLGMIQGISFGIVFTTAAVPFAWLADRRPRKKIIGWAVIVWSALTAACGFVTSGLGLLVTRSGVALGEAALGPSAAPLIRELFPPDRSVRALSIYMVGIPLGSGLALLVGATLLPWATEMGNLTIAGATLKPWQTMMMLVALPGFFLGALTFLIPEPKRLRSPDSLRQSVTAPLGYLALHWRTFVGFGLPGVAAMVMTFGAGFWLPAALTRAYALSPEETAHFLQLWGLASIVLGFGGTLLGGILIQWARAQRNDAFVFVTMATVLVLCSSYGLFLFAPTPLLALAALVPAGLGIALPPLVATSAALELIPRVMRSSLLGVWMMAVSLIGMSSGPPLIGFLIDHAVDGPENVGWAFAAAGAGGVLLVVPVLLLVRRPYLETQAAAVAADQLTETEPT